MVAGVARHGPRLLSEVRLSRICNASSPFGRCRPVDRAARGGAGVSIRAEPGPDGGIALFFRRTSAAAPWRCRHSAGLHAFGGRADRPVSPRHDDGLSLPYPGRLWLLCLECVDGVWPAALLGRTEVAPRVGRRGLPAGLFRAGNAQLCRSPAPPGRHLFFFLVTNFADWYFFDTYAKTGRGLLDCYTLAIPFFRRGTLLADVLGSASSSSGPRPIFEMHAAREAEAERV